MPHSSQRSGILMLAMIASLSTGCDYSGFLKTSSASNEGPASIALSYSYPSGVIMADSNFSIIPAVIHYENEKPVWESFHASLDQKNKKYILSGRIQRSASLSMGKLRVSTMSVVLQAPDVASASMFLFIPQEDCQASEEMLKKFSYQIHPYRSSQPIFFQPKSIPILLQTPSIPFRTIYNSFRSYDFPAENRVLNSQLELDQFFEEHSNKLFGDPANRMQTPTPPPPTLPAESIDFATEQVIFVSFGAQWTGMIDGKIAIIEKQADRLLVHPVLWIPLSEAFTGDIGYPSHFVVIKRSTKPIDFAPVIEGFHSEAS